MRHGWPLTLMLCTDQTLAGPPDVPHPNGVVAPPPSHDDLPRITSKRPESLPVDGRSLRRRSRKLNRAFPPPPSAIRVKARNFHADIGDTRVSSLADVRRRR